MIKSRIIINIYDDTPQKIAMERVARVIDGGRISLKGKSYCLGTIFSDGVNVFVQEHRKADVFTVYTHKRNET